MVDNWVYVSEGISAQVWFHPQTRRAVALQLLVTCRVVGLRCRRSTGSFRLFYVEKISNTPHSTGNQLPKQLHRVYVVITEITVSSLVFSKKIIFNYGGMRKWLPRRVSQTMAPLCETWNLSSELFPLRT